MRRNGDCSSSSSSRSAAPTTVYVFLLYLYLCSHLLAPIFFFILSLGFLYIHLESKLDLDTQFTYVLLTTDKHLFFFSNVLQILRSTHFSILLTYALNTALTSIYTCCDVFKMFYEKPRGLCEVLDASVVAD